MIPISHLDVVGQIMVEAGDVPLRVEARGDSIIVELPGLRAGASLFRRYRRGNREAIEGLHRGLVAAGLALIVRVGPRELARLGVGARPGLASRLLGVGPLEIHAAGLLMGRRRPGP